MNLPWLKSLPAKMPTAEELKRAKASALMDALKKWEQWKKAKDEYDEAFKPRRIPERPRPQPIPMPDYYPHYRPHYVPGPGWPYETLMSSEHFTRSTASSRS